MTDLKSSWSIRLISGLAFFLIGILVGRIDLNSNQVKQFGMAQQDPGFGKDNSIKLQVGDLAPDLETDLAIQALNGDLDAANRIFNIYTYHYRDYVGSYFWAIVAERLGYDTKFGSISESAEANIIAKFSSRRHSSEKDGDEPAQFQSELPPQ